MIGLAGILSVLFAAPVRAKSQEAGSKPEMMAMPGGAEMERLKFYLGEWDYAESYPNGGKNTGVYTSKLGPGGNSLVQTFHSKGPVGDFEGLLVMTWDPKEKAYKSYVFSGDAPGCVIETGQFEEDVLIYRERYMNHTTALGEVYFPGWPVEPRDGVSTDLATKPATHSFEPAAGSLTTA